MGTVSSTLSGVISNNIKIIDKMQDGTLWTVLRNASTNFKLYYSKDAGQTWIDSGNTLPTGFCVSIFIDADNYLHYARKVDNSGPPYYSRGTPNGANTSWTFAPEIQVQGYGTSGYPSYSDIVAFKVGTGWKAFISVGRNLGSTQYLTYCARMDITSGGVISNDANVNFNSYNSNGSVGNVEQWSSIDFQHTGDGKTPVVSPLIYIWYSTNDSVGNKFVNLISVNNTFTAQSATTLLATINTTNVNGIYNTRLLKMEFDGRYVNCVWVETLTPSVIRLGSYDTTNSTWTILTSPASNGNIQSISMSYDANKNIYLHASMTPLYPQINLYTRLGGTWSGWTNLDTAGSNNSINVSARSGYQPGSSIDVVYDVSNATYFKRTSLNTAPNAPTLIPHANFDANVGQQNFLWTFSDPDAGNTQTAYQTIFSRVSDGVTIYDSGKIISTSGQTSVSANFLSNGIHYTWQVRTWDNSDVVGPYSSQSTFWTFAPALFFGNIF